MAQERDVEQDLSHIHWSWPEAIAANPARSLATADLAMDYFAYSPFFDTNSNNSVLRTQRRVENPAYGHAEEKIELNAFRSGFEYIIAHSQPPELFIIHRRDVKDDGTRTSITAAYFILQDKIYPTPTLYGVIAARLKNASHLISNTFTTLSSSHPPSNPRATSQWRSLPPSAPPLPDSFTAPVAPPAEDVEMSSGTPIPVTQSSTKKIIIQKTPDYHLFNALQATRMALPDLDKMASAEPEIIDPREELKALEAQIMGTGGGKDKAGMGGGRGLGRQVSAIPARNVSAVGGSPAVSGSIGQGRAMSVGTSGLGQSPAVR